MTTPPSHMPPAPPAGGFPGTPTAPEKQKNVLGRIAVITAVVGFIFACIPGALIVGWILLPIAFILGIVGLFQAGKRKGTSTAAVIIAIVGIVVGFVVFATVVSDAVDDAFGGSGDVSVTTPGDTASAAGVAAAGTENTGSGDSASSSEQGTRGNPYPIGSTITDGDWQVTVNSVTLNADDAVTAENPFNDAPAAGSQYLLADVTVTYTGSDPQGKMPFTSIDYVTADGNTVNSFDSMVVAPDPLDTLSPLFEGASTTGNLVFTAPSASAGQGTLAIQATPLSDKVFVAVS
ncbi:DUF4352 domain-containing protein [Tomitella fengzijianii]|uniref:DUF4352 domain-containing protein n=1 Tax=Tomitella fengzijianii TaxID=2597660 RepID=A0A516X355_9ACTN|nr:DUF4352 domain-containing protein [Tomitella fengzijianii]QDQ97494.1 DUF4352 domain-containing protein [Tomitella fengzijianii]